MTINLDNFKIYIGYHYGYIDDNYYGSGKIIMRVVKKKTPVSKVILEIVDENTWSERERFWISYFNSTNYEIGYNLMDGGECGPRMVGDKNYMYGKTHTDEVKERLSIMSKQRYIDEPERLAEVSRHHKGKTMSDEFKEYKRLAMMGNEPTNRKRCKYNGIEYPSLTHLAKFLGISKQAVKHRVKTNNYGIELL